MQLEDAVAPGTGSLKGTLMKKLLSKLFICILKKIYIWWIRRLLISCIKDFSPPLEFDMIFHGEGIDVSCRGGKVGIFLLVTFVLSKCKIQVCSLQGS